MKKSIEMTVDFDRAHPPSQELVKGFGELVAGHLGHRDFTYQSEVTENYVGRIVQLHLWAEWGGH